MIVNKYTAETKEKAIMKAREDLGPSAVVLNVKLMKQRGIFRIFKKDYYEITAAMQEEEYENKVNQKKNTFEKELSTQSKHVDTVVGDSPKPQNKVDTQEVKNPDAIERKLDNLHDMLKNQMTREENRKDEEVNENKEKPASSAKMNIKSLRLIYNKLIENEVDEKYANAIINDIETSLKKESNIDTILASVYQKIVLKIGEPNVINDTGKKQVIFFIGPTGVGKTTTIAKLASAFKLNRNKKVAMLTADTYRIAAVEQLEKYANIIDVPVRKILTPSEICEAIGELEQSEIVFVDTAGRSHKNEEQRQEVIEMVTNVTKSDLNVEVSVFLVLSVTTKYKDLISIADAYKELENVRLLFTKLDETNSFGNILNLHLYTKAPLSYTTNGQSVPDDIETVDVQMLAKRLLGGE